MSGRWCMAQIHLPALARLVKQTAVEFGLPYKEYPSLFSAVRSHLLFLKRLGAADEFEGTPETTDYVVGLARGRS